MNLQETPVKTLGLLGGMSWESTLPYYRQINETVRDQLGGLHSARLILYSVDFHDIERMQSSGDWSGAAAHLGAVAQTLERAGAEGLVLCTNTMHKLAEAIEASVHIPLLHIADPTADALAQAGHRCVGLLGTRFTMEQDFYRGRLEQKFGLTVLTPALDHQALVHRVIYEELCRGQVRPDSRVALVQVIDDLGTRGAQAIILGCTELTLLLGATDCTLPLFDTARLHARSAALWALGAARGQGRA